MVSVDSILKGFNKTVKKLNKLADQNEAAIADNERQIETLDSINSRLKSETARAIEVADKLENLIS